MTRAPRTSPTRPKVPVRVLGYARVSSDAQEREGTSLEAQQDILRAHCEEHGWPAPVLFVEVESGGELAREQRVEQVRLERELREGDAIVVCHTDRWSRDVVYTLESVRRFVRRGVRWIATEEGIHAEPPDVIPSTLIDRAADAEKERARIKQRTVGTRRRLRAQGFHVEGQPPIGYRVEKRKLVPSDEADVVRRFFALAAEGLSVREIAPVIATEFPDARGVDHAAIGRRLRDRRYLGESCTVGSRKPGRRSTDGEWLTGTHEAIIDARTWARVQRGLDARKLGGRKPGEEARCAHHLLRSGLLLCAHCGRVMASHVGNRPYELAHGGYYVCRRPLDQPTNARCERGPTARASDVDERVFEAIEARLVALAERLSKPPKKTATPKPNRKHDVDRAKLVAKLARLVDAVAAGVLSHATARAKIEEVETTIRRLDDRAALAQEAPRVDRAELLAQVGAVQRAWRGLDIEGRRAAVRLLAEKIEIRSTAERRWERGAWKLRITWRNLLN